MTRTALIHAISSVTTPSCAPPYAMAPHTRRHEFEHKQTSLFDKSAGGLIAAVELRETADAALARASGAFNNRCGAVAPIMIGEVLLELVAMSDDVGHANEEL
jgi:hypothetical protein